jgi:hypothetical protein
MNSFNITINDLAVLAKEAAVTDPIDWGKLNLTEDYAYQMMASSVIEQFENLPENQKFVVSMATITKLLVENFVLNVKLQELKR